MTHFRGRVAIFGQYGNGETTMSDKLNTASDLTFRNQARPFSLEPEETVTVNAIKPSFLKRRRKAVQKLQSNPNYSQHLAEETLSRVLQLELRLGRTLTMFDLYNHFSREELTPEILDAVLTYYPDIRSFPEDVELEISGSW